MARRATLQPTDTITVEDACNAVREATAALQERVVALTAQLDDERRDNIRLREELQTAEDDGCVVANMIDDLDHALAFGFTDRVADILASNPYNMLTRNMIQIAFTA